MKNNDITNKELQLHANQLFPDGFSYHGNRYFLNNKSLANQAASAIELLFEYIRQSSFSEIQSRFQVFFAWETLDEAKKFKRLFGKKDSAIFEIYSDGPYFKGNMNLLSNKQPVLVSSFLSHEYWKGNSGVDNDPFWEVMLTLPVIIGKECSSLDYCN